MRHLRVIDQLLHEQRGLVARWQLTARGLPESTIDRQLAGLRPLLAGVRVSGHEVATPWQLARAATLSAPSTVLCDWSAAALAGIPVLAGGAHNVARPGSGGRARFAGTTLSRGPLLVRYSATLEPDAIVVDGIPTLAVPRIVRDLMCRLNGERRARLVRDVLRLGLATPPELHVQIARHRGERGVAILRGLVDEYAPLNLGRERSDAEAVARSLLAAAGLSFDALNVAVAGHEADFVAWKRRLILELDGPQYHQFLRRDAAIQAAWEQAGFVVRRVPTGDVYAHAHALLAAAGAPVTPSERMRAASTVDANAVLDRWRAVGRYEWSPSAR